MLPKFKVTSAYRYLDFHIREPRSLNLVIKPWSTWQIATSFLLSNPTKLFHLTFYVFFCSTTHQYRQTATASLAYPGRKD